MDKILELDLEFLEEGEELILEYKRFLILKYNNGDYDEPFELSPSYDVDRIWHKHILHTKKYQEMCYSLGHFFHHTPKSMEDKKKERYEKTIKLYKETFGVTPSAKYWSDDKTLVAKKPTDKVNITVKTLTGKNVLISNVPLNQSVAYVKRRYMELEGVPEDQQRHIFAGMQLEDGRPLFEYNIRHDVTFHLVTRLSGC